MFDEQHALKSFGQHRSHCTTSITTIFGSNYLSVSCKRFSRHALSQRLYRLAILLAGWLAESKVSWDILRPTTHYIYILYVLHLRVQHIMLRVQTTTHYVESTWISTMYFFGPFLFLVDRQSTNHVSPESKKGHLYLVLSTMVVQCFFISWVAEVSSRKLLRVAATLYTSLEDDDLAPTAAPAPTAAAVAPAAAARPAKSPKASKVERVKAIFDQFEPWRWTGSAWLAPAVEQRSGVLFRKGNRCIMTDFM